MIEDRDIEKVRNVNWLIDKLNRIAKMSEEERKEILELLCAEADKTAEEHRRGEHFMDEYIERRREEIVLWGFERKVEPSPKRRIKKVKQVMVMEMTDRVLFTLQLHTMIESWAVFWLNLLFLLVIFAR
jgi:hypothetical protein